MKVLVVSSFYPPHHFGGYELRCAQVAEYLQQAGHDIRVLTSSYRSPADGNSSAEHLAEPTPAIPIERSLCYYPLNGRRSDRFYTLAMARHQLREARRFLQLLDDFRPDVVNWWNMKGLTKTLLPLPATRGIPDVYCVADTWLVTEFGLCGEKEPLSWFSFWRGAWGPAFFRPVLRRILVPWERRIQKQGIPTRPFRTAPSHVWFVSESLRFEHAKAGLAFPSSEVVHSGVSPEQFYVRRSPTDYQTRPLRLLYAGQLSHQRGLHTIVEALGLLPESLRENVDLSVAYTGPANTPYVEGVKSRITQLGLSNRIQFCGTKRRDEMPQVYQERDVLIFASTRPEEGLPLTMMEAMCAGCAVITTGSGGAIEIADLADLPIFPNDHPVALSRLIAKLLTSPDLVPAIAKRGQDVALSKFAFARMAETYCETLHRLGEQRTPNARMATYTTPEARLDLSSSHSHISS